MRILLLTGSLPYPPTSGGALRAFGFIKGLATQGHTVTLLSLAEQPDQIAEALTALCDAIHTVPLPARKKSERIIDLITGKADVARRLFSDEFQTKLLELISQQTFDVVQFEGIEIACYLPAVAALPRHPKIIFDTFNAEAELQHVFYTIDRTNPRRWHAALYSWIQAQRIHAYEACLCQLADVVIAVSPEDAEILGRYPDVSQVDIVPSGIFTETYATAQTSITLKSPALVFTGKMDYRPNVDAMLWFIDTIKPALRDAHVYIVGQQPHSRLQTLTTDTHVHLTGWVDSVIPYLEAADVYIAPLRMGSGTRLKLLEAMACGCAIVCTTLAASGLLPEVKRAMIIADQPDDFAGAVQQLLNDPDERQRLGKQAQTLVQANYDWEQLIPRMQAIYERLQRG